MTPISLTRPAFAVTCACYTLYEIVCLPSRAPGVRCTGSSGTTCQKTTAQRFAPAATGHGAACCSSSTRPSCPTCAMRRGSASSGTKGAPFVATAGRRVSAALVPAGQPVPDPLTSGERHAVAAGAEAPPHGRGAVPDVRPPVRGGQVPRAALRRKHRPPHPDRRLPGGRRRRSSRAENVTIADTAVFRTKDGPVVLEKDVEVADFAYFVGPVHVGARTRVIERASLKEHVCIGETCKIGGEVEASIIESFTNKQHHGFLGHSWVGSWVNLGAGHEQQRPEEHLRRGAPGVSRTAAWTRGCSSSGASSGTSQRARSTRASSPARSSACPACSTGSSAPTCPASATTRAPSGRSPSAPWTRPCSSRSGCSRAAASTRPRRTLHLLRDVFELTRTRAADLRRAAGALSLSSD